MPQQGEITITTNEPQFSASVKRFAEAAMINIFDAFWDQTRLLGREMIDRTPPFSGKAIKKMLGAQGKSIGWRDAEIEDLGAKKVGERRVEKDIRKVIYGVSAQAAAPSRDHTRNPVVYQSQNYRPTQDWGVLQKCQGKPAVRIFATQGGDVFGVDLERFKAEATFDDMRQTHWSQRGKRGRVTTAGQRDRVVGRWVWMDVLVTKEELVKKYIAMAQKGVGQAKGGWVDGFILLGGKCPTWISRHRKAGKGINASTPGHFSFTFLNNSKWASGGDPDRIIQKSLAGREEALKGRIVHELEKQWGKGAGVSAIKDL
jgi:hypothetical protein